MLFDGTVVASAFVFKGKEFKFDYDGFFIDLAKIDSIIVKGKGSKGSVMRARKESDFALTNKSRTSAGKLYINRPDNKSGRKKLGAYPAFDASTGAYVFFNKPEVLGGAYDTDDVLRHPAVPHRLAQQQKPLGGGLQGHVRVGWYHARLPDQADAAGGRFAGLYLQCAQGRLRALRRQGTLFNKVVMSNRGLQGIGNIKYLTGDFAASSSSSTADSVVTVGKTGRHHAGAAERDGVCQVDLLPGYQMKWVVKVDSMYLSTPKEGQAMRFYTGDYQFRGTATLTPGGLYGNRPPRRPQSFIRSPQFAFKPKSYSGKQSTLSIKSAEPNKPALVANEVAFQYDLQKNFADFTARRRARPASTCPTPTTGPR